MTAAEPLRARSRRSGPSHLPVHGHRPGAGAADERARHRRPAPLAPRRRSRRSLRAGYDLVYVYAGARPDDAPALPLAPLQRPHRRVRRQPREPRAAAARDPRGHARGGRRPGGGRLPDLRRRAARRRAASSAARSRRCSALVGELPDVWDFMVGEWDFDSITSRFADEGAQEEYVRGLKQLTIEAGGRRRPVHLARHDGADGPRRRARPDRRGAAVDRRPVPAEEDRGGPLGGHPRVHRLQHLRHRRLRRRRRSAAPRTRRMGEEWRRGWHPERIRPKASDAKVLVVGAGPGGPRGGDVARPARLRGRARRGDATSSAAGSLREARLPGLAAWIRVVDYRRGQLAAAARTSRSALEQPARPPTRSLSYGFDHVAVATGARWRARRRRPLAHAAARARRGVAGAHARRPAGRRAARRRARRRLRRRPLLPGRRARRAARRARAVTSRSSRPSRARLGVDGQHDGAAPHPARGCSSWASTSPTSHALVGGAAAAVARRVRLHRARARASPATRSCS